MPYKSLAQERWAHTPSGEKALGSEGVKEWDAATKGKKLPKHLAKGGEIAPAHLENPDIRPASPYKVLKEEADHFVVSHVRDPEKAFRVAKFGLGHKTLHHIRNQMEPVQHLDEGGPVLNSTFAEDQGAGQAPEESGAAPKPPTYLTMADALKPGELPHGMDADKAGGFVTQATSRDPKTAEGGQDFYGPNTPSLLENQYDKLFTDEAKPPEQQQAKMPGAPSYNGMPELDRRQKQFEAGQLEWASAMGALGDEQAKIRETEVKQRNAVAAKAEEDRQAMTAKIDQTVNDIKNFKIDPERHWGTGSTAVFNKTLAGIGMIISGAGAGYTGQQNMALQVVNKAIDRDIDAQKSDLANKHSLLNVYFKQYGNINDAETRAKVDLSANVQAQLDMALSKAKGPVAQAQIQQAMAENGMRMVQMRDQLVNSQAQRANSAVDLQLKQFQLQMEKRKLDMFNQLSQHTGAGGGVDANTVATMKLLDPKRAESFARGPDGQFYEARDGEAAKNVDKAVSDEKPFLSNIERAKTGLAKLGAVSRWTPEFLRSPEAQATLAEIQDAIQQTTKAGNGLNRFTGEEGRRNEISIGNWRANPKAAIAALETLSKTGKDRLTGVMRQSFLSTRPAEMLETQVGTRSPNEK